MWWWIGRSLGIICCLGFTFFGINLLVGAYGLDSPHYFVLTFFASNLIILISITILVGFCLQIFQRIRARGLKSKHDQQDSGLMP